MYTWVRSLTHLAIFSKNLSTWPPSISKIFVELHCTVSTLSDQALLPRTAQGLWFPSRKFAMHNSGINPVDCHPEMCRSCPWIHLSLCFPQAYISSLTLVNRWIWLEQWPRATLISKNTQKLSNLPSWRNCIDMRDKHPLPVTTLSLEIAQFCQVVPLLDCSPRLLKIA